VAGAQEILRRILRNTFWDSYDFLGTLIITSTLFSLLCVFVAPIPLAVAGILEVGYRVAVAREATVRHFWLGMKRLGLKSLGLVLVSLAVLLLSLLDVCFYLHMRDAFGFVGMALAALCLWALVAFALGQMFVVPLATREGLGLKGAFKQGYLLMMAHVGVTLAAAFYLLLIALLLVFTGAGIVVLLPGVTAVFLQHVAGEVLAELAGRGDTRANERRSLRELLPPWDHDLRP